jgi:lipoyl(octanoyl) transferase
MDLEPFQRINPCGHQGLRVTSMASLLPGPAPTVDLLGRRLLSVLAASLEGD